MSMKKGELPPGTGLEAYATVKSKTGRWLVSTAPRCQFVKAIVDETKTKKNGGTYVYKKYGVQCKQKAAKGRPFCRFHGGRSGRTPAPNSTRSKYRPVPSGLQALFEQSIEDPALLDLTSKIALLDSAIWKIADDAKGKKNFNDKDMAKLLKLIHDQKSLIEQETNRRIAIGSMMDVKDVLSIINYIYNSIIKNVKDAGARAAVSADLRQLVQGVRLPTTVARSSAVESIAKRGAHEEITGPA